MRPRLVLATTLLLGAVGGGCADPLSNPDAFYQSTDGTGGGAGTGGTGGTGGNGGGTTTSSTAVPAECVPSTAGDVVSDECGVFVSSSLGSDANDGTKAKPFATITAAFESANGKPLYLCGEAFAESVSIANSSTIYGGLDCASDWKYIGDTARSTLTAAEDAIPLRVLANQTLTAANIKVVAANAKAAGGSSIAILAEANATLDLLKSDVEAGNGAPGEDGMDVEGMAGAGQNGVDGGAPCSAATVNGGVGPLNECGDVDSIGGPGGTGFQNSAGPGGPGEPGSDVNDNAGGGEVGANNCGNGTAGTPGAAGAPGAGAKAAIGTLNPETGFAGIAGVSGQPGQPGQGGGGGGGARGGVTGGGLNKCASAASAGGASGGSGASGGCGGVGGPGGGPGGASIAIVSLGATLVFEEVTLTAKDAGAGGDGGDGQLGGGGGTGGKAGTVDAAMTDLNAACKGGNGGAGGKGGRGGGGLGGHSLGIAYLGEPPDTTKATVTVGVPGDGGLGDTAETNGDLGLAVPTRDFN